MEQSIFKKLCDLFIGFPFWEQILFASLVFIILLIVPCCILCWIRTRSISNVFAWTDVRSFRASQLYWRLRKVRNGRMNYERFVDEYSNVHIKDYDIEKREKQREHAKILYWNKFFRELACQRRDLVEKYLMGPEFSRTMYKQLMKELLFTESNMAKEEVGPEVITIEEQAGGDKFANKTAAKSKTIEKPNKEYNRLEDIRTLKAPENLKDVLHSFFSRRKITGLRIWGVILALQEKGYVVAEDVGIGDYMRVFRTEGFIHKMDDNAVYNAISREAGGEKSDRIVDIKKELEDLFNKIQ